MVQPRNPKANRRFLALAFLIPLVGMLMVMLISGYKPFGQYSMLYSDMYHQYYPFFVSFRRALLSGESLLYNWDVGMGTDYIGLIAYYLASPLNLLSILVPESLLLSFFSLLMPVKLGLASLFFAFLLKNLFRKNDLSISVFGAFYGLCAWALGYQWNIMWLDTFALLPLVVLGMVSLLRERKFALYTLTLFLSVAANYYIGLFTCIFIGLLFFCYEICRGRGQKRFFADLGCMAFFSVLALGMASVLMFSALAALQTTQSSVNAFPHGFRLNIAAKNTVLGLLDAMRKVAGNMGGSMEPTFKEGLPNLYCGVGTILFAMLFVVAREVKLRDKLCAVGLLVFFNLSFVIRQLDYIWHGFHFTNMIPYRFSFLYSFVLLYMAYRAWLLRRKFDALEIASAGFLTVAILCCGSDFTSTRCVEFAGVKLEIHVYLWYNFGFLLAYLLALFVGLRMRRLPADSDEQQRSLYRARTRSKRVLSRAVALTVAGAELVSLLVSFGLYFPGIGVSNYPKGKEEAASMIRYMHQRERELFYRAETTHSQTLNDGALNGYYGISAFTSSANVRVTEFTKALGYGAKNTYNRYCFEESSPVANLFLGLKYMIERDGRDRTSTFFSEVHHFGNVHLLENTAYLPLGFLAENALADVNFSTGDDSFKFQNGLFTAATGVSGEVWQLLRGDDVLTVTGNGATVTDSSSGGYCSYSGCVSDSSVTFSYKPTKAGFMCIRLDLPKRNDFVVSINGVDVYRENISLPQMLAVGDVTPEDVVDIRVLCKNDESGSMTVTAALLDETLFRRGYDVLAASTLELTEFHSTSLAGRIQCNRDGLLYLSIPQNGNWEASVDGKTVETELVGDCMIAIPLSQGDHNVSLRYHNRVFALTGRISLACTMVFAVLIFVVYKPNIPGIKKKKPGRFQAK